MTELQTIQAAAAPALAVGDDVELVDAVGHVKGVKPGQRGRVLVADLPFGAVSVSFGPTSRAAPDGRVFMLRAQHLRKVGPQAPEED
jgi:ketopantoate hydroxymethyltransferase